MAFFGALAEMVTHAVKLMETSSTDPLILYMQLCS